MLVSLAISFVLSALKEAVKNPSKKASLRAKMLEIAEFIQIIYGAEPEFQAVARPKYQ